MGGLKKVLRPHETSVQLTSKSERRQPPGGNASWRGFQMIRRFSDQAISAGRGRSWTIRTGIAGLVVLRVLAVSPIVASASTVVYDVNLNFDPTTQEGGPGVGIVTGTFTIDTATDLITAIDLTEKTNTNDTIGSCCGFPAVTSVTFNVLPLSSIDFGVKPLFPLVRTQQIAASSMGLRAAPRFSLTSLTRAVGTCSLETSIRLRPTLAISMAR
jgi:hypothetical protein